MVLRGNNDNFNAKDTDPHLRPPLTDPVKFGATSFFLLQLKSPEALDFQGADNCIVNHPWRPQAGVTAHLLDPLCQQPPHVLGWRSGRGTCLPLWLPHSPEVATRHTWAGGRAVRACAPRREKGEEQEVPPAQPRGRRGAGGLERPGPRA